MAKWALLLPSPWRFPVPFQQQVERSGTVRVTLRSGTGGGSGSASSFENLLRGLAAAHPHMALSSFDSNLGVFYQQNTNTRGGPMS